MQTAAKPNLNQEPAPVGAEQPYFGEDWEQAERPKGRNAPTPKAGDPASAGAKRAADPRAASAIWTLVLATFTGEGSENSAREAIANLRLVAPHIAANARVQPTAKGAMVIFGHYTGRDDAQAAADQKQLKALRFQNRALFGRVILTRVDLAPEPGKLHPYDLRSARAAHPKVDPLYTLDVALWDDFDSGTMSYDEIRRQAEAYATQLRAQHVEAWFYHDDALERSVVTVGVFDKNAINERSGLYSTEVTMLAKRFPARLVNGAPMMEYKDKYRPQLGTEPQTPVLVLVPD